MRESVFNSNALALKRMKSKASGTGSESEQDPVCTKIYYASRTHSQLSQVVSELQKLKFYVDVSITSHADPGTSATHPGKRPVEEEGADECLSETAYSTRLVSLGSRKQLCINETLRARAGDLDEACRQMLGG